MAGTVRSICVAALTLLLLGIWTFLNEGTIAAETPNIGRLNTNVVITGTNLLGGSSSSISVSLAGVAVFPSSGQSGMRAFIFRHGLEDDTIFHRFHYESYLKDEVVYANTRPSSIFLLQDTLLQYTISRYSSRKKKKRKFASSRYFLIKSKRFRFFRPRRTVSLRETEAAAKPPFRIEIETKPIETSVFCLCFARVAFYVRNEARVALSLVVTL